MRRGEGAAVWGIGGAWQCAVRTFDWESKSCDALNRGSTAMKTGEKDRPCTEAGRTKDACMDGMVSQHCIASSGVDMARQSNAYIARAITITASKIGLAIRIRTKVGGSQSEVKGAKPPSANAN